ncbi:MAG TPA: DUF5995 family protein [Acidimicrobiales bacterium]|nr:DUF5995 family protein [Acidimicrobiales bacterium]
MTLPTSVDEVLAALDALIQRSIQDKDRIGYFAAVYRNVTQRVKDGIAEPGFFDDPARMEALDVVFANRFLAAAAGPDPTRSWEAALRAAQSPRPIILQHLLVGINAHINLDLGIAAATVAPGHKLAGLRGDFDRINEILASLMAGVEDDVCELSPWIGLLRRIGGRDGDALVKFSIEVARTEAWAFASELAPLAPDHWPGPIGARDAVVARLAHTVLHPGWLSVGLTVIRSREGNDVGRTIEALGNAVEPPSLDVVQARVQQPRAG